MGFPYSLAFKLGGSEPDQALIDRYRSALIKLLPPGDGLAKWVGSNVYKLVEGLAIELARVHVRALNMLDEAVPSSSNELLGEWETLVGLPDECATASTLAERQALVVARLRGLGGHTQTEYESIASSLGATVTSVVRFPITRCTSPCDSTIRSDEWSNVVKWRITDSLTATAPNGRVECEFERRKRRHAHFIYGWIHPDSNVIADETGEAILDEAGNYVLDEGG